MSAVHVAIVLMLAGASVPAAASDELAERAAALCRKAEGLDVEVATLALRAFERAKRQGVVKRDVLTVIDYSRSSREPRLWVLDLAHDTLLFRELVAHGKNSGGDRPSSFSNEEGSLKSSLGLFVTEGTYQGQHGYSLRLRGLDPGINDRAAARAIVIHGAEYVDAEAAARQGRLGRSWGCPALSTDVASAVIDRTKDGTALFAYYPDPRLLASARAQ